MEFTYELRVPKERVAVLIGKNGNIKSQIESATNTKIDINSKEGEVTLTGEDGLGIYSAKEIVRAISRGFNPDYALLLLKQDFNFEIFNITDYAGKNKNASLRLKGRVIGKEGKSRRIIEELTETHICVYGKTVGIIGETQRVSVARRAIEALLTGSPHSNVYRWLERQHKELKKNELLGKEI